MTDDPRGPVGPGVRVEVRSFSELDITTAYAVWRLRQEVFVVEQACPYSDLDSRDEEPGTHHVLLHEAGSTGGTRDTGDTHDTGDTQEARLIGYLRVLDEGDHARIGRVVLARSARGRGLADVLMSAGVEAAAGRPVVLDAQTPLAGWYATHGFAVAGPEFLEDGIAHVPMLRPGSRSPA